MSSLNIRPIEGYPYSVSDEGDVYRVLPDGGLRLVKPYKNEKGYLLVELWKGNARYRPFVHRLVLAAFVGPCPEGMQTRHLDGDPGNNRLCNLAWGTAKENSADQQRHGTQVRGERVGTARMDEEKVRAIRFLLSRGWSRRSLARVFGLTRHLITDIANGKAWGHVE